MANRGRWVTGACAAALATASALPAQVAPPTPSTPANTAHPAEWPAQSSPIPRDPAIEAKIDRLLELQMGREAAQGEIADIDERFLRHHGHAAPWGNTSDGRE